MRSDTPGTSAAPARLNIPEPVRPSTSSNFINQGLQNRTDHPVQGPDIPGVIDTRLDDALVGVRTPCADRPAMPELPDIVIYIECLERRIAGARLDKVSVIGPNVLKTCDPPLSGIFSCRVVGLRRIGKRIAIGLEGGPHLVLHLMIAGHLRWLDPGARPPGRRGLAAFGFETGTLVLTEAGARRRASLHVVAGEAGLARAGCGRDRGAHCRSG